MADFTQNKQLMPITQILAPGGTGTIRDLTADAWFSPLQPIRPTAPTGFRPRQYAYQPGANLVWTPKGEEAITFDVLRALADSWDLLRLVIETRKDQLSKTKFELRLRPIAGESSTERKAKSKSDQMLDDLKSFFKHPDGFHPFNSWMRMWLEDMNVIDGVALYMQRDKAGKVAAIHPLDGATVNRMLTEQGFTPPAPSVAYQQVLYGTPQCDLTTDDLLYSMRNERPHRRYGYSRVEQILLTISIALRRQEFQLQYYTSGNMPEAMCFLPSDLPIDKVKEVQEWFDSLFAGDLAQRRRLTFLPGYGSGDHAKPNVIFPKEVLLKDEMDDWLARIVCFAFGVSATALQKAMNRASAQAGNESAKEEGLEPDVEQCLIVLNGCLHKMGVGDRYEWATPQRREIDVLKQAQADNLLVGKVYTINELRAARGEEPREEPEADMLGVFSQAGFVPIDERPELPGATDDKPETVPKTKEKTLSLRRI